MKCQGKYITYMVTGKQTRGIDNAVIFAQKMQSVTCTSPELPGVQAGAMESTKAEQSAEPRTKDELRAAAKSAREQAKRHEILADAQKGTASEPEDTGRGRTRRRERRGTRSSSGKKRQWKEKSKDDKKRRLGTRSTIGKR